MPGTLRRRGGQSALDVTSESMPDTDDKQPHLNPEVESHAEVVGDKPKTRKRRNMFIFLLGSLCGIVAAGFFASTNDLIEFPDIGELKLDTLLDVLPAGMVREYRDLIVCAPSRSYTPLRYL